MGCWAVQDTRTCGWRQDSGRSEAWGEGAAWGPQCQYKGQRLGDRCGLGGCWEQCWVLSAGDLGAECWVLGAEYWMLHAECWGSVC